MSLSGYLMLVGGVLAAVAVLALYLMIKERRAQEVFARENARLLEEARVREQERSRLADRLVRAEQEERRRLALFLHDGPVQHLSGIALMLDAAMHELEQGRGEQARSIVRNALDRHRETIRSLRDLSFNIEPVVLRDQGFGAAVLELGNQLGLEHAVQIDVDVVDAERLSESVQAGLYQVIRDALGQAVRRGPPTRIALVVHDLPDGRIETVIEDDGTGERRRDAVEALAERASTLHGELTVETRAAGGTSIRVVLPAYASIADPPRRG